MKKNIKKNIIGILCIAIIISFSYFFFQRVENTFAKISSFEECLAAGFPILESYPEQCKMPGKTFINNKQVYAKKESSISSQKDARYKNTSYTIDGVSIEFLHGEGTIFESTALHKNSSSTFTIIDNPLLADITYDAVPDTFFFIKKTSNTGNAPEKYYLASSVSLYKEALQNSVMYLGSTLSLPEMTVKDGILHVTYRETSSGTQQKIFMFKNASLQEKINKSQ